MTAGAFAAVAVLVFGWAVVSGALARHNVTGPLVFAVAGYLLGNPDWGPLVIAVETSSIHAIAEVTLALLLFSDAARVDLRELRSEAALPGRLLGIGLPLSVVAGTLLAAMLFDLPGALALFVGAALAPTDAALSVQVINDERVPVSLRRSLNVESGLNDGLVTPLVSLAVAVAASQLGQVAESAPYELGTAVGDIGIGALVGITMGTVGALASSVAASHGWMARGSARIAVLALALGSFAVTLAAGGNGFIAAFVAGAAFGTVGERRGIDVERADDLPELGGELLALVVWFLFGAGVLPVAIAHTDWRVALYGVLSLTAVRIVPVVVSMIGSGLDRRSTLFLAWFGPRGLASVVFAMLAIEELGEANHAVRLAVTAVALTVAGSVLLHGITAGPGGRRLASGGAPRAASARGVRSRRPVGR